MRDDLEELIAGGIDPAIAVAMIHNGPPVASKPGGRSAFDIGLLIGLAVGIVAILFGWL
jgi:hypothetical protein